MVATYIPKEGGCRPILLEGRAEWRNSNRQSGFVAPVGKPTEILARLARFVAIPQSNPGCIAGSPIWEGPPR